MLLSSSSLLGTEVERQDGEKGEGEGEGERERKGTRNAWGLFRTEL